jgi:hypothetical protein
MAQEKKQLVDGRTLVDAVDFFVIFFLPSLRKWSNGSGNNPALRRLDQAADVLRQGKIARSARPFGNTSISTMESNTFATLKTRLPPHTNEQSVIIFFRNF